MIINKRVPSSRMWLAGHPLSVLCLISSEQIACVYFLFNVVKAFIVAVGNDGIAKLLEFAKVVDYTASEECGAVFQCRFIYNDGCPFGFNSFHNALNGALTEIV